MYILQMILYETTKEDFINMFKHYAEEVKNYLY